MSDHYSEDKLLLAKQLEKDFAADLLTFCGKWQDNFKLMDLVQECGIIMSIPLMDAAMGHVLAMELLSNKRGSLTKTLLDYGANRAKQTWENTSAIKAEVQAEVMEMLKKAQRTRGR